MRIKPAPLRNPLRRLGDRTILNLSGASLLDSAPGSVAPTRLQIGGLRWDLGKWDTDSFGTRELLLWDRGHYDIDSEVYGK